MKILTMAVPGLNNNVNLIDLKLDNLNINKNTLNNFIFRIFLLGLRASHSYIYILFFLQFE